MEAANINYRTRRTPENPKGCGTRLLGMSQSYECEERFLDCAGRPLRRSEAERKSRPAPLGMTPWVLVAKGPYRAPRGRRFPARNGGRNRAAEPKSCATA